MYVYVEVTGF